jgi:hypothetical protein
VLPTLISMAPTAATPMTGVGVAVGVGRSICGAGASTVTGNNLIESYSPARNARRHLNNKLVFTPCSIAKRATDTPGSQASVARRRRNSTG